MLKVMKECFGNVVFTCHQSFNYFNLICNTKTNLKHVYKLITGQGGVDDFYVFWWLKSVSRIWVFMPSIWPYLAVASRAWPNLGAPLQKLENLNMLKVFNMQNLKC